jgi:4-carboxymuconolactone decarboxylase
MTTPRMLPIARDAMSAAQRAAADELAAGPRRGVKGPFIALLRSPELMARLQRVGELLRFESVLSTNVSELATLVVAREWTQAFEWCVHVPLALRAGVSAATIEALREGRRPPGATPEEALVCDLLAELTTTKGLCDASYAAAIERFGEAGLVELVALVGYFTLISMVLNVARTPAETVDGVAPLAPFPL